MKFEEWYRKSGMKVNEIAYKAGVSDEFIYRLIRGVKVKNYSKAKAVSDLTRGKVKAWELCEGRE